MMLCHLHKCTASGNVFELSFLLSCLDAYVAMIRNG
jgi:hypothetical protein